MKKILSVFLTLSCITLFIPKVLSQELDDKVLLTQGGSLVGHIKENTENYIILHSPSFGDLKINKSKIKKIDKVTLLNSRQTFKPKRNAPNKKESIEPLTLKKKSVDKKSKSEKLSLKKAFKRLKWITYSPSHYIPGQEKNLSISEIKKDLKVLKQAGFNALVTYTANGVMSQIPKLAHELEFKATILGIWNPLDSQEFEKALESSNYVFGFCVGNEGLHNKRYTLEKLRKTTKKIKDLTQKPVTTSEPLNVIFDKQYFEYWRELDWLFPIAHFVFDEEIKDKNPQTGAKWLLSIQKSIQKQIRLKTPIVFKEVGYPTYGEDWANEKDQKRFFKKISNKNILFCFFEAYDQPWKIETGGFGPHWGLFNAHRKPKQYISKYMNS